MKAFTQSLGSLAMVIGLMALAAGVFGLGLLCTAEGATSESLATPFGTLNVSPAVTLGTSLRLAAREGRVKTVDSLLSQGADVNASGEFGETALMYAARFDHVKVAETLLAHGAFVNEGDYRDQTALMRAAMNCSSRIVARMLERDANVNLLDHDGKNALIYAAANGCQKTVPLLLKARGIDVNVIDDAGKTALDYVMEEVQTEVGGPYSEIARALRAAGAKTRTFVLIPPNAAAEPQGDRRAIP